MCVGVHCRNHNSGEATDHLQFNIIPLDDAPRGHPGTHTNNLLHRRQFNIFTIILSKIKWDIRLSITHSRLNMDIFIYTYILTYSCMIGFTDGESLKVKQVTQLDRDTVLIALGGILIKSGFKMYSLWLNYLHQSSLLWFLQTLWKLWICRAAPVKAWFQSSHSTSTLKHWVSTTKIL